MEVVTPVAALVNDMAVERPSRMIDRHGRDWGYVDTSKVNANLSGLSASPRRRRLRPRLPLA